MPTAVYIGSKSARAGPEFIQRFGLHSYFFVAGAASSVNWSKRSQDASIALRYSSALGYACCCPHLVARRGPLMRGHSAFRSAIGANLLVEG